MNTQNGILSTLAAALAGYAAATLQTNFWQAIVAGVIAIVIYVGVEFLRSKGINVAGKLAGRK